MFCAVCYMAVCQLSNTVRLCVHSPRGPLTLILRALTSTLTPSGMTTSFDATTNFMAAYFAPPPLLAPTNDAKRLSAQSHAVLSRRPWGLASSRTTGCVHGSPKYNFEACRGMECDAATCPCRCPAISACSCVGSSKLALSVTHVRKCCATRNAQTM